MESRGGREGGRDRGTGNPSSDSAAQHLYLGSGSNCLCKHLLTTRQNIWKIYKWELALDLVCQMCVGGALTSRWAIFEEHTLLNTTPRAYLSGQLQ